MQRLETYHSRHGTQSEPCIPTDGQNYHASQVLDHLLCEHDDIPHTWHLLALAHYAGQNFEEAWDALQYGLKVMQNRGTADDDMTAMFKELQECLTDAQKTGQGGVGQTCDDNS